MEWQVEYEKWKQFEGLDQELRRQLDEMERVCRQLVNCFSDELKFGLDGMHGKLGPGPNRINKYNVRKVAEGLAQYMKEKSIYDRVRGVVIAYDSQNQSAEFALEAAKTIGLHGIPIYFFDQSSPIPVLSFATRYLNAYAGIVFTTNNDLADYLEVKVYGADGAQLRTKEATKLMEQVDKIQNALDVEVANVPELTLINLITSLGDEVDQAYLAELQKIVVNPAVISENDLCIVYTSSNGSTKKLIKPALSSIGFINIHEYEEASVSDASFSSISSNSALVKYMAGYGNEVRADMLLMIAPEGGRLRVAIKDGSSEYQLLSSNQLAVLILHYIISQMQTKGELPRHGTIVKTLVTSELGREIALTFGLKTIDTLNGFKYIGEKVNELAHATEHRFLFGYDACNGYLISDFVRDQDGMQAAILIAEVAAFYKSKDMTLYDAQLELFDTYGYFLEDVATFVPGEQDQKTYMDEVYRYFRVANEQAKLANQLISEVEDYRARERIFVQKRKSESIQLPMANILKVKLLNESWFCIVESDEEAALCIYLGVKATGRFEGERMLSELRDNVIDCLKQFQKVTV
ncbi:phospho-sugar mutase [Radiobacillus sp. PE A8.2]|uniref:phospho-sugar mutase n=1 Tax=Radiobacillus sp. PE A8.2 TaxID=3380349 RepID=UPI00388DDABA